MKDILEFVAAAYAEEERLIVTIDGRNETVRVELRSEHGPRFGAEETVNWLTIFNASVGPVALAKTAVATARRLYARLSGLDQPAAAPTD